MRNLLHPQVKLQAFFIWNAKQADRFPFLFSCLSLCSYLFIFQRLTPDKEGSCLSLWKWASKIVLGEEPNLKFRWWRKL